MLLPLLAVVFIVVPLAELYVILQVGQAIGVLPTIALLIADSVLGSILMRSQGRAVWRRFQDALAAHRPPAREIADGALVILGGAFLLTPGFVTDVIGLTLLLPPTRAFYRRLLLRALGGPILVRVAGSRRRQTPQPAPHESHDVEGTASEVDPRALP